MPFRSLRVTLVIVLALLPARITFSGPAFAQERNGTESVSASVVAGPHLDGNAYRALRRGKDHEVLVFQILITHGGGNRFLTIYLGPNYVIQREKDFVSIYDFRFHRLLHINLGHGDFSNNSLFGKWQVRWAFLQNNLFAISIVAAAGGGQEAPALMRFWIEQSNGLNYPQETVGSSLPKPQIRAQTKKNRLIIKAEELTVATVTVGDMAFPSSAHTSAFAAWLAWPMRFHPDVAMKIASHGTLPRRIDRVIMEQGKEQKPSSIQVQNFEASTGDFDVLKNLDAKTPGWEPYFPAALAELMVSAARGEAPNGPVSDREYIKRINVLVDSGDFLDAFLLAVHASHPYDGCRNEELAKNLCRAVSLAARQAANDPSTKVLIKAINSDSSGKHAEAARIFISLRAKNPARPDILEFMIMNALVEAKKDGRLDDALKAEFTTIPSRITAAFERDPYDPARYRDYYNYIHAAVAGLEHAYEVHLRAYPVLDLARVLPQRRIPKIISSVTDVEKRISRDFPIHFPQ